MPPYSHKSTITGASASPTLAVTKQMQFPITLAGVRLFLALCSFIAPLSGLAEVVYVASTGEGKAVSRKDALGEALSDAVGRINGIAIATKSHDELEELAATHNDQSTVVTSQSTKKTVDTSTAGIVRRYKVVKEEPDAKGVIRIVIEAEVAHYEAKESDRLRLAILPFGNDMPHYTAPGADIEAATVSRRFVQVLVNNLTSCRKFAIIDHEFDDARGAEIARLLSGKIRADERGRLGQELAADYVLVGKIENFSIVEDNVTFMGGTSTKILGGRLNIPFRVIDLASGATVLAQGADVDLRIPILGNDRSNDEVISRLVKAAGTRVSERILQTIYPIRVVELGEELVLNTGGENLSEGQRMKVYNLGKRLEEPYTGEFLGYEEILAGDAEVTRVLPKVAYAAVRAKIKDIKTGAICRPDSSRDSADDSGNATKTQKTIRKEIDELFK